MDINDIKHLAVERIYLVPDASEGQLGYAWCDDPAPGVDMDPSEAVEYVRRDVHEARIAELEAQVEQHRTAEEMQIALREKADEREAALAAHVERLNSFARACSEELVSMIDKHNVQSDSDGSWLYDHQTPWELMNAVHNTPATSLARRDKIKQAEALERLPKGAWLTLDDAMECLDDFAREHRQQAEQC